MQYHITTTAILTTKSNARLYCPQFARLLLLFAAARPHAPPHFLRSTGLVVAPVLRMVRYWPPSPAAEIEEVSVGGALGREVTLALPNMELLKEGAMNAPAEGDVKLEGGLDETPYDDTPGKLRKVDDPATDPPNVFRARLPPAPAGGVAFQPAALEVNGSGAPAEVAAGVEYSVPPV